MPITVKPTFLLLGAIPWVDSLRLQPNNALKHAVVTSMCSACLLTGAPDRALALPPSLNDAIVELSEASYPILKAQQANFGPFQSQVGELILKLKPDKLAKSISLGLDAFDTVPADTVSALTKTLKEEYAGVKPDSCSLVPLPPQAFVEKFQASAALSKVDGSKLAAFQDKWGASYAAVPRTDAAICLPASPAALDKLALAQADVGRAIAPAEAKAFGVWTQAMLKSGIGLSDALPLADAAKKLAPSATPAEKIRFEKAGKMIGNAAAGEAAKARVAAQQAAKEAAVAKAGQQKAEARAAVDPEATKGMTAAERAKAEASARASR